MIRALWTAATGMLAQQLNVDNISNNLANVNTAGYKKSRVEFQDLFYQTLRPAGGESASGESTPAPLEVGMGTRAVATPKEFSQGDHQQTDNPLDWAIEGGGFFQVTMPDGVLAYTRSGAFKIDGEGRVVTAEGQPLEPAVTVPSDAKDLTLASDGTLSARLPGDPQPSVIGSLELARFVNPAGLKSLGHNLYQETSASGAPVTGAPGTEGMGTVLGGALEMSNVRVIDEMVNMITAQRAYEIGSKAIQTSDDMIRISNNLRA
jgi:flagellar basal-body rod protein FlgG